MILTNRLFIRKKPSREAKSIYIFCEGVKREYQYFQYFKEMDSRINVEIYRLDPHENNSPKGLMNIAKNCIIQSLDNPNPKYTFQENDEVWIVMDTDTDRDNSRETQISDVRKECSKLINWNIAQSNPCFEVWLYYHLEKTNPILDEKEKCKKWKGLVNSSIQGGFQSNRHPIYIEDATINAENNFKIEDQNISLGCTEVFNLSKSILPLIKSKINDAKILLE